MEEFVRVVGIFVLFGFLILCRHFVIEIGNQSWIIIDSLPCSCSYSLRKSEV